MCTLLIQRFGGSILGIEKFSKFSEEALAKLRKNPYIAHVLNGYMLEFTQEFQEIAYQELLKGDKTMREILQNHGIDPEILGSGRINTFSYRLRKRKHGATNIQNAYNVSQKEREVATSSMDETPKRVESQQDKVSRYDLRNNPYVADIVNGQIIFTEQFKDLAAREIMKNDKTAREIFQDFGFDVQVLGGNRIAHFARALRERARQLRENQNDIDQNDKSEYNTSPKNREGTLTAMNMNSSNEDYIELLKQQQASDETDVPKKNQDVEVSQEPFTEEERLSLLNNQYVSGVTNDSVQFTEEFKELAYNEFLKSGKPMREIFREHGIDPEILGSKRIWNFTAKLQGKAKKSQGFGDARKYNKRRPACTPIEEKALTVRVRDLEHELAYMRQEVEFLKKTQMADMEARILWESKQSRKKNSH